MNAFLVITLQLLNHLKISTPQYYPVQYQQNPVQTFEPQSRDYGEEIAYRSDRRRSKYYTNPETYDRADDCESSEECKCPCSECNDPPPKCKEECDACLPEAGEGRSLLAQSNVIFLPVPYLMVVPYNNSTSNGISASTIRQITMKKGTPTPESSTTTTLTSTTTTSTQCPGSANRLSRPSNVYDKGPVLGRSYRNLPTMEFRNMTPLRRIRPTWMPKYGIVPIPDRLAEKLMSQLREMKSLRRQSVGNDYVQR